MQLQKSRWRRRGFPALFAVLIFCLTLVGCEQRAAPQPGKDGVLTARFMDVGQGDCNLILLPDGKTLLIDAGEKEYVDQVVRRIKDWGISRLDYVVVTHPHSDHMGGMAQVIKSFEIGAFYMPKKSHNTKSFESLLDAVKEKGLTIKTAKAGVTLLDENGVYAALLAPAEEEYDELNNYSAVLKLTYGDTTFLYMGDAESKSEKQMLEWADVKTDVLKVGHHGSNTSSSKGFLEKAAPRYAVISCGADNSYQHPSKEIVKRLEKQGIEVLRTDQNGTVTITSDGKALSIETEKGGN